MRRKNQFKNENNNLRNENTDLKERLKLLKDELTAKYEVHFYQIVRSYYLKKNPFLSFD